MEGQTWNPILKSQKSFKPKLVWKVRPGTLFWNHRADLSQSWYGRSELEPYSETTGQFYANLGIEGQIWNSILKPQDNFKPVGMEGPTWKPILKPLSFKIWKVKLGILSYNQVLHS